MSFASPGECLNQEIAERVTRRAAGSRAPSYPYLANEVSAGNEAVE